MRCKRKRGEATLHARHHPPITHNLDTAEVGTHLVVIQLLLLGVELHLRWVLAGDGLRRATDPRWGRTQGAVDLMWSLVRDAEIHTHKLGQLARPHRRANDRR
jgi:hypothetical protein